jgi:FlaA1/EpsC-like NDP-sugar epimerase
VHTRILLPLINQPRIIKRAFAVSLDIVLCALSIWLLFCLRLEAVVPIASLPAWPLIIALSIGLPLLMATGFYRIIIRYSGWSVLKTLAWPGSIYGLFYTLIFTGIGISGVPRSLGIVQPILWLFAMAGWRALVSRLVLDGLLDKNLRSLSQRVLIYGAGSAGRQLALGLQQGYEMQVVGFLDDDSNLHNNLINNLPVYDPAVLEDVVSARMIDTVLLALPSVNRARRHEIVEQLLKYQLNVRTLPGLADLAYGKVAVNDLKELDIADLLGRDPVEPNLALLHKKIANKVVLVTGAGGSIGSELCRQILALEPARLVLIDHSEYALYTIHAELEERLPEDKKELVVPILASVCDEGRMALVFNVWQPDTVYHAAAYKHVPLVEANPVEGIRNNVFGTLTVARAAVDNGTADFVMISTDKAVRPTNVMGASKRLAEMIIQSLAAKSQSTCFSMVRFGNVLGSSGSVIPRFRQQILNGGPITLTHKDIIRYFMTIPEAVQLVIQAGAMAKGGEVFVLDMGEPVRIHDLAESMIRLSGLTVKNDQKPDGDIEIKITGLRPGEKLFEELLIGEKSQPSTHPRILVASEQYTSNVESAKSFELLRTSCIKNDANTGVQTLRRLIDAAAPDVLEKVA